MTAQDFKRDNRRHLGELIESIRNGEELFCFTCGVQITLPIDPNIISYESAWTRCGECVEAYKADQRAIKRLAMQLSNICEDAPSLAVAVNECKEFLEDTKAKF